MYILAHLKHFRNANIITIIQCLDVRTNIWMYRKVEGKTAGHDLVGLERDGAERDIATSRGRPGRRSQCFGKLGSLHDNHGGDTHEQPLYDTHDDIARKDTELRPDRSCFRAALIEYNPAPALRHCRSTVSHNRPDDFERK